MTTLKIKKSIGRVECGLFEADSFTGEPPYWGVFPEGDSSFESIIVGFSLHDWDNNSSEILAKEFVKEWNKSIKLKRKK